MNQMTNQSDLYTKGDNPLSLSEKRSISPSLTHIYMYIYINSNYSVHYLKTFSGGMKLFDYELYSQPYNHTQKLTYKSKRNLE